MSVRVCLITTGQPSTNPRLIKEADVLTAAGYDVHVIGAHWAQWADRADAEVLRQRTWSCQVIDWRREWSPWLFWKTRLRFAAARAACQTASGRRAWATTAAGRLTPELAAAALAWPADLYIAHNLGAWPAAAAAADRHGARLGIDAEDWHSGQASPGDGVTATVARAIEERLLGRCDYVTAASPGIASAYRPLCRRSPVVVLNVFPLADRPAAPAEPATGPLRLYWFSQTIGRDRGLDTIVSAMGQSSAPIELHLRGVWQAGYEHELRESARKAGVLGSRIVAHEPAAPGHMVRLAAEYDIGLALETGRTPNSDVALSNKLFTYLLAGLPVVASATSAQAALVRDLGSAGVAVPVGDAAALARTLQRWVDDPDTLAAARRTAWQLGSTTYNWDVEQHRFLDVVQSVMGGRPRAAAPVRGRAS